MPASDEPWNRAANWLAAWDAHGNHRTATAGDAAGAEWLAAEAASLGADAAVEEFALERLDPVAAFLEFGGERLPAIPAFDAPATTGDGIEGRLGPVESDAEIAVAELPPQAVYSGEYERLRRRANTGAGTAPLSSCAPGKVRVWRCSTPRASDTRSAGRRSMYRARRESTCLRRRRAATPPGSSQRAAEQKRAPAISSSRSMPPAATAPCRRSSS